MKNNIDGEIYKFKKDWKVFFNIVGGSFLVLFLWMLVYPFTEKRLDLAIYLVPIALILISILILTLLIIHKSHYILCEDKITKVGLFKSQTLSLNEIKGYINVLRDMLTIIPIDDKVKSIKVWKVYGRGLKIEEWTEIGERIEIEKWIGIEKWIEINLKALNKTNFIKECKEILNNETYGRNRKERALFYKKAQNWSIYLLCVPLTAFLWATFYPYPYKIMLLILAVLPFIVLFTTKFFRGIFAFESYKKSAYPSIGGSFFLLLIVPCARALFNCHPLFYYKLLIPGGIASIVLFFISLCFALKDRKEKFVLLSLLMFCTVFGFSMTSLYNQAFDKSKPVVYKVKVEGKRIRRIKGWTKRYLKLSTWGPQEKSKNWKVNKKTYNQTQIGDTFDVKLKKGRFGIPWYYVITK